jgi:hypothetical protein
VSYRISGTSVYFAQADYGGPIKIGHSYDHGFRIQTIGKDLPFNLVEIGSFPGGLWRERFVQCWFRSSHIKGEWFEPHPELWRWALQARTRKHIPEVPEDPPWGFHASVKTLLHRLNLVKATLDHVAAAVGRERATIEPLFRRKTIRSANVLAACAACIVRRGRPFEWDFLGAQPQDVIDEKKAAAA